MIFSSCEHPDSEEHQIRLPPPQPLLNQGGFCEERKMPPVIKGKEINRMSFLSWMHH